MATRTSFHVIDLMSVVAVDAQICVQRHGIGSSREWISLGGRVVVCCVAATSSDRSGISASTTGFRDKASATVLRTPGMCSTRNRYRSDFSLMFLNRGFGMSSRARSPSTFSSGLWSNQYSQVWASQCKMSCLVESVYDRQSLALDWRIS